VIRRWLSTGSSVLLVAAAAVGHAPVANAGVAPARAHHQFALAAGATVLTLEGGLVGLQHLLHFTPLQLRGDLCDSPNRCAPVDYFAMPLGQKFNDDGAVTLNQAIRALPDNDDPVVLYGHSQGGQVIYSALRGWAADPATAPDPARLSWVSIGNPENTFGGRDPDPIPADSPYQGTEVIRQYDGWADWPTDQSNLLAVLNAVIGMSTVHASYFNVDIDDPANRRYVEGNVTYVFVPNPMLPLIQATGLLAPLLNPVLDPILRPLVEAGYQRPVDLTPGPAAPVAAQAIAAQSAAESAPEPVRTPDSQPDSPRPAAAAGPAEPGTAPADPGPPRTRAFNSRRQAAAASSAGVSSAAASTDAQAGAERVAAPREARKSSAAGAREGRHR
jgi:hypothetical protein